MEQDHGGPCAGFMPGGSTPSEAVERRAAASLYRLLMSAVRAVLGLG